MKDPSRINNTPSLSSIELILHEQFINDDNPFVEYMWMENEEEFNRQVEEELWEEEFIEQCFQEMLEEEENEWFIPARDLPPTLGQLQDQLNLLVLSDTGIVHSLAINSNLNPVPGLKH
ncbi:polyadenylate-binding protein-interacting protein 2-like [Oncorhynchus keta]|uniref:polyadenylate-binding protein-interacting protein 2-like n=1 Tax=Oncorhynchus keta TaxID=8018 RepID=UPI00227B0279|nr:polyadenylate-binding protein-interacting protein 2-like [Oncorhynchus keta]